MKTEAVLFTGENQVQIGPVELPPIKADELRVETMFTCLSPGTDLRVLSGKQVGDWAWPVIPGYSMVGQVVDRGTGTLGEFELGDRVFCIGTQAASCDLLWGANIAAGNVHVNHAVKIPDGLEWEKASMAKLAAIAYHGSTRSGILKGAEVIVIGMGPIGIFSALFHRYWGADVTVLDLSQARLDQVAKMGLKGVRVMGTLKESLEETLPNGADVIVDCTGVPSLINQSMELSRELPWDDSWEKGSKLVIQGSYPDQICLDYDLAFQREIQVLFTRDNQRRDLADVMEWMKATDVPFQSVMTDLRSHTEASKAFEDLVQKKDQFLTIGLDWR